MLIVRDEDGGVVHTWPTHPVTGEFSQVTGPIANRLRSRVRKPVLSRVLVEWARCHSLPRGRDNGRGAGPRVAVRLGHPRDGR